MRRGVSACLVIWMSDGLARQLQGLVDEWVQSLSQRLQPDVTKLVHEHIKVEGARYLCVCCVSVFLRVIYHPVTRSISHFRIPT